MKTTLYQLELDNRAIDCGMSYVFHLRDGRFFIIDGGYFTDGEEDRLYDFLKECSGDTPVIAGWFFSHAHQDHVGSFIKFIWKYAGEVTIQRLIYNFQEVDFSQIDGDWKSSDPATVREFYKTVEEYCADIPVITPHTGDCFKIGEVSVEVIYTHEDLYPSQSTFNDYSTVITTSVEGQKILWTGDIYREGSRIMTEKKKDKLRCDIVQVAHHGFAGATIELYAQTGARVALWPTTDYVMEKIRENSPRIDDNEVNLFLLKDMGIQEHLVSGYGTAKLTLPYALGTAEISPKKFFGRPDRYA